MNRRGVARGEWGGRGCTLTGKGLHGLRAGPGSRGIRGAAGRKEDRSASSLGTYGDGHGMPRGEVERKSR